MEQVRQETYRIFHGPSLVAPFEAVTVEFATAFNSALPVSNIQNLLRTLLPQHIELSIAWPEGVLPLPELAALLAHAIQDIHGPNFLPHETSVVFEGQTKVTIGFLDADAAVIALRAGVALAHAVFAQATGAATVDSKHLSRFVMQAVSMENHQPDDVSRALIRASHRRGIPVTPLVRGTGMWLYGEGVHGFHFARSSTHLDSQIGMRLARDKYRTGEFVKSLGLPFVDHVPVTSAQQAVQIARRFGYPVVVKPLFGSRGRGVSVDVTDDEAVASSFAKARDNTTEPVLVERFVAGDHLRLSIFGGKLLRASRVVPPNIVGDGISSVSQLIEAENRSRGDEDVASGLMRRVIINSEMTNLLWSQGFALKDIPPVGKRLLLRRNSNLATGGLLEDVTAELHPDNRKMAETIARALHLDAVAIDFITTDPTASWREGRGKVIEANVQPGIGDVIAERVIAQKFNGNGRVPAILVIDTSCDTAEQISRLLEAKGYNVGEVSPTTTSLGDELRFISDAQLPDRIRALLVDPACEALVVSALPEELAEHGLPYAKFSLAVIAASVTPAPELERLLIAHVTNVVYGDLSEETLGPTIDQVLATAGRRERADQPCHSGKGGV